METEKHFKLPDSVLPKDIIDAQKEDVYTKRIIENIKDNNHGPYFIHEGILYIERNLKTGPKFCLVVPLALRELAFRMCHNDMGGGHLGMKKSWPKVRDRFYWNTMYQDLRRWLKSCSPCAKRKTPKVSKSY